jgi:cysteate synthase
MARQPSVDTGNTHFRIVCSYCGAAYCDDGLLLDCKVPHEPSLLMSQYKSERFEVNDAVTGLFRYRSWLPSQRDLSCYSGTVTYRSQKLAALIGLSRLWIAFNGYWPERQAFLDTSTFKELEAYAVLSRLPEKLTAPLLIASAGNTGEAFANVCSKFQIPCVIIVPGQSIKAMCFARPLSNCVKIVSISEPSDYNDALSLAALCSQQTDFIVEGGVRNVARRDGIGTTLLNAVEAIGRLPDFYFQAIGSGTGAIAAHEAAKRIIKDGRFSTVVPRLLLSQNLPFAPVYFSWKRGQRTLVEGNDISYSAEIEKTFAKVLSNARPPYSVIGGLFDCLSQSNGDVIAVDNQQAIDATKVFQDLEGVDIEPAAGVAVASLIKVAQSGEIAKNAVVLLHITGGGRAKRLDSGALYPVRPTLEIRKSMCLEKDTVRVIQRLFLPSGEAACVR